MAKNKQQVKVQKAPVIKRTEGNIFSQITGHKYFDIILPGLFFAIMAIFAFIYHKVGDYGVETDFFWGYVPEAKDLLHGVLDINPVKGPVYQVVLAVTGLLFGKNFFNAGIFINLVCAAFTIFVVLKTLRKCTDNVIAACVTLFMIFNPWFLKFSYSAGTDLLFMVFYFASIYFLFRRDALDIKNAIFAGICCGIAYLTRYTGIALIISASLVILLIYRVKDKNFKNALKPLAAFLGPVMLFVVAWGITCLALRGQFFYNDNYLNTANTVYKTENMTNDEWTYQMQPTFHSIKDVIFRDFGLFIRKIFFDNFTGHFTKDLSTLFPLFIGIPVAIGLFFFLIRFKKNTLKENLLFLTTLIFYFFILLVFYSERFSLPMLPLYGLVFVKLFRNELFESFNFKLGGAKVLTLIMAGLMIWYGYTSIKFIREDVDAGPKEILVISEAFKKNQKEDTENLITMSRKPHIAYYMGTKFTAVPLVKDTVDLVTKIKEANADFLYMGQLEVGLMGNKFGFMITSPEKAPKELEPLFVIKNPPSVLYKVKK